MTENELATIVVDIAFKIHTKLGPGLLESAYEAIMIHELKRRGLAIEFQKPVPIVWDGEELGVGFRADIIVEGKLVLELKSIEEVAPFTRNN
jgi:GxxExxY protein